MRESPFESILVAGILSPSIHPGAHAALTRLASGFAESEARSVELKIIEEESLRGLIRLSIVAAFAPQDVVVLRHVGVAAPFVCLVGTLLRIRGRLLILQVPTPMSSARLDTNIRRSRAFRRLSQLVVAAMHPLVFIVPHLIVQYAPERGRMARLGRRKSVIISHPVDLPVASPGRRANERGVVRAVGVAGSARSPGFDRFLHGLALLRTSEAPPKLEVVLVGHDEVFVTEIKLVEELNLQDTVTFTGPLFGAELEAVLSSATFGLGTLAGHRVGLSVASPLKHRTYLGRGIPFVTAITDPSLTSDAPWIHQVAADDSAIGVAAVLDWLVSVVNDDVRREMQTWARENLSAEAIALHVLNELSERV